ncbi:cytochrome P450 2U1-like [Glandiceps talaboti]
MEDYPCYIGGLLNQSVSNVICSITFGRRFQYSDPKFQSLLHSMERWADLFTRISKANSFPVLKWFLKRELKEHDIHVAKVVSFCENEIEEHRATLDPSNIRDFIDAYLNEAENQNRDEFTASQLKLILVDLFIAGTRTTATTIKWVLLFMVLHPEIQEQVFQEIDKVVGRHRRPKLKDMSSLPFTESVLLEAQRIGSITPLSLPHAASKDSTLQNYKIPKGTTVITNLWTVHHDPVAWPEPDKFDPYRFYDDDSKTVKRHESFLPFSAGLETELSTDLTYSRQILEQMKNAASLANDLRNIVP